MYLDMFQGINDVKDNGDVKETVESMKDDLLELTKQMNGMSTQMSLLISKLNLK